MRTKVPFLAALVLAACGGSGSGSAQGPDVRFGVGPYAAIDLAGAPAEGPADAWVTIVEFLDYACPYCEAASPILEEVRAAHSADVRVVIKMFPLVAIHGEGVVRAARAALCAHEQGLFWPIHAALFAHAPAFSDAQVESYAADVGVDMTAWRACYASEASLVAVNADVALGAANRVAGTPTFFIDGKAVVGAFPVVVMDRLVREAQAAAEASGVPRADYYDKVILGR
jgi:protein-disulfide isomerase